MLASQKCVDYSSRPRLCFVGDWDRVQHIYMYMLKNSWALGILEIM